MPLPQHVRIVEVGPRDGLQNEPGTLTTETKLELIHRLADAGLPTVEATAFVSPKWVPQMADHDTVLRAIRRKPGVNYPVLTPNMKGFEAAADAGAEEVAVFGAASEAFSQANINRTVAESLTMFAPVIHRAKDHGLRVRGYVSTVCGCPYQGTVPVEDVVRVTASLFELGVDEVSLGDTIGVGTAGQVAELIGEVAHHVLVDRLAVHMHDTYGQGLANTLAALGEGVEIVDASAGGLGGCPYAPGAAGNLATEDAVSMLHSMGVDTGVDLEKLVDCSRLASSLIGRDLPSKYLKAHLGKQARERRQKERAEGAGGG